MSRLFCSILECDSFFLSPTTMFVPFSAHEPPMRMLAGPANATAPHVLAFQNINLDVRPVRLTIRPEPGSLARECFMKAKQRVEREGEAICYGWTIWEWPRVFVDAEHHAVYEAADGSLHDTTPSPEEEDTKQTARRGRAARVCRFSQ